MRTPDRPPAGTSVSDVAGLAAIDALVPDAHRRGAALGVVADASGVLVEESHDEPLVTDLARVAPLPSLGPLLEWRERRPAYVVALVDRAGADLVAFGRGGETHEATVGDPDRHDPLLHRVRTGGWSQPRYERRVVGQWEADAKQVASTIAGLAEEVSASLVLVGGDVRALELLEGALPASLAARVVAIPGSRAAGGDVEEMTEAVARAVADEVARAHVAALRALEELADKHVSCVGAATTLEAIGRGPVDLLLVNDDPNDDRVAFLTRDPFVGAPDPDPVRALGREPTRGRLVDVMIAGALSSGAAVRIVPAAAALREGVGALLRFATET